MIAILIILLNLNLILAGQCPGTTPCSGHGTCNNAGQTGLCTCNTGYSGTDCSCKFKLTFI